MKINLTGVCALALIIITVAPINSNADTRSGTELTGSSGPIITLTEIHGSIEDYIARPLLRIFANGRVRVDLAENMKGAGSYEYRLQPSALRDVLSKLERLGLMSVDVQNLAVQRDAHMRARQGQHFLTLDSTLTRIELNFDQYSLNGGKAQALRETVEWLDLGIDAERFSTLKELRDLNDARLILLELTRHQRYDAVRVQEGE